MSGVGIEINFAGFPPIGSESALRRGSSGPLRSRPTIATETAGAAVGLGAAFAESVRAERHGFLGLNHEPQVLLARFRGNRPGHVQYRLTVVAGLEFDA